MDHLSPGIPPPPGPAGRSAAPLDEVDRAIIRELQADGRLSMRALAERVSVSRSNAYTRVERLVAEGVVTGFTARLDPVRAGLGTAAYVLVNIEQNSWRTVSARLREVPCVEHLAFVGGDVDLVMLVRTPDNASLRDVVLSRVHAVEGVRSTRTWLIFDEPPPSG
ncbi:MULTISPECIES: Lrp/AsnC family transcriptional regulator [Actinomadura]|uniref:DNA-binding Lrp family transcriptional regulator n=1 Tax=Actinomadura livida TaxID=79909 RepID=A0A7W7ICH5_9ACTN|nr:MULTISPECIES: Lrp/AsnC family transcriptional regulator [Actinomadura]MBB4774579.1 DNA-binding Lrp family transcriptional regulator [Actinomadura catellatispora]TDB93232.1 Lrp/AsnC family transcriptional regulator [Actinomadura sp. 7K534]GGU07336.1 AsnC family transcriptional regulator [Actinomadura livida]